MRSRVERLLRFGDVPQREDQQGSLDIDTRVDPEVAIPHPNKSIVEFLDFVSDVVPDGDVYLFGGVLRDVALFGYRGFASDLDLVVEGDWDHCVKYLASLGAHQNKFGGFRLDVAGWPVDIWNATDTWAIRQGLVRYHGIASLTETTVLNWDAILMNWRTGAFVCREGYLEDLRERTLDVVLVANPNPLGMIVRVFRHLCSKEARRVTSAAAKFLTESTTRYSYTDIVNAERRSYGNSMIKRDTYKLFEQMNDSEATSFSLGAIEIHRGELQLV
ncbi:nucleotidyltransferase domain-containing protein [Steroidobacter flavus]|uniref:Nucleotidyltransferase domain-containing protein n=1 Tax=Steroidobacter flavus TaxID=1842136 RepID=A0ABV8SUU8_9GAMM